MDEIPPKKREYTLKERWLLLAALAIGIAFDRIVVYMLDYGKTELWGAFWLSYLAVFYLLYWERLQKNRILWSIGLCAAALCVWGFIFDGNYEYGLLTMLVIPGVLMAHAVLTAGNYTPKESASIAAAWFSGWFVKPFTGLPAMAGAAGSIASGGRRGTVVKALIGVGVTIPLLAILIPLLSGADQVFGYYLSRILENWDFGSLVGHTIFAVIAAALFYSFLWNIGFGRKQTAVAPVTAEIDRVICRVVLGAVSLLYLLFCGFQFTYLFAGADLPEGITYVSYVHEGFAQTVVVCAINLLLFGVFLRFCRRDKALTILLAGLLGLTGVMLLSGFVRLSFYIEACGLTWLRLLSAWFILWLAAVIVLCAVRLFRESLPAVFLCALLLLVWYVALGYANPDAIVSGYNEGKIYEIVPWDSIR